MSAPGRIVRETGNIGQKEIEKVLELFQLQWLSLIQDRLEVGGCNLTRWLKDYRAKFHYSKCPK